MRRDSWKSFEKAPLPTKKDEEWKYTDLAGFAPVQPQEFGVFIGGPKGIDARPMPAALDAYAGILKKFFSTETKDKFAMFNAATWTNGYFVRVPAGFQSKVPIIVKHTAFDPASSRSVIVAEPGSRVTICEIFEGSAPVHYGTLDVRAADNAEVNLVTIQRFSDATCDHSCKRIECGRDSRVNWTFALLGGKTTRLKTDASFTGAGSSATIRGAYFGTGGQNFSIITRCAHAAQNTGARVDTRGVLKDSSSSLTRGLIRIEREARGTDSHLNDRTLHLNSGVTSNSIPSLEIENNDVRASHGASTGKIDENKLFYMMSRGVSREDAEALIVEGFLAPIVDGIMEESVREGVKELIADKLGLRPVKAVKKISKEVGS